MRHRSVVAVVVLLVFAVACSDSSADTTFTTRADAAAEEAAIAEIRSAAPWADLSDGELLLAVYASCNAPPSLGPSSPLKATKDQLMEWSRLSPSLKDMNSDDDPFAEMGMRQRLELAYTAMGVEFDQTSDFARHVLNASLHVCPWVAEDQLKALNL